MLWKKKLKKMIKELYVPPYDLSEIEKTIILSKKIISYPEKYRMTNLDFYLSQIRFIHKSTWALKISITFIIGYLILNQEMSKDSWLWSFVAILGPLICLANASEFCNIYQPRMLEIQLTAKNSLKRILMVRLCVFGIIDFITLLGAVTVVTSFHMTMLFQMIIYAIVPYNLMCCGCMYILNRQKDENSLLYCITWGGLLVMAIIVLKIMDCRIFNIKYLICWIVEGGISGIGVIMGIKKLMKLAGGNLYDFKYGTFNKTI